MTLPRGKAKEEMIRAGDKVSRAQEEKARLAKEAEENAKRDAETVAFAKLVADCKESAERNILYAIKKGQRETSITIGKNYAVSRYLEAWTKAVVSLRKTYGKEYKFDLHEKRLYCNNSCEAANVDGVSYQEWTEDVHELTVTW